MPEQAELRPMDFTAIVETTRDPKRARALGQAGRKRASEKSTPEKSVEAYRKILESLQ